jgi:cytochrome c553
MKMTNTTKSMFFGLALLTTSWLSASAAEPKESWEKTCTKCHGSDGKGATKIGKVLGIKDFTDAQYHNSLKDEQMIKAIKEGIKDGDNTKMKPAEGLNDEDIKALVAYVRAFKK